MKLVSRIFISLIILGGVASCRPPGKDYKLTEKQSRRIHQDQVYRRSRADKHMDAEKLARREKESERLQHNLKVANSRNPAKKMALKQKSAPFSHH